jgi:hypothetical protein
MPIIRDVQLWFPRLAADRPEQYQNKGARRWKVQIRTTLKAEAERWKKEYGLKVTPEEGDKGIYYKATVTSRAFDPVEGSDGQIDNLEKPRKSPAVILGNGQPLDPYSIGNGSVGDVSFSLRTMDSGDRIRTLTGVAVRRLLKREVREEDSFELSDDVEIVEEGSETEDSLF